MKITLHSSLAVCVAAVLLGAGLSGCSNGNKRIDISHMSKAQQVQALGQMDDRTRAMEAKLTVSTQAMMKAGAKSAPPPMTAPSTGQQ